jgi:pimeloyl-ACP methyl ester carboxylesterase
VLLEALGGTVRLFYRTLGADTFEHETDRATVRGFRFEPDDPEQTIVLVHGLGDASTTWHEQVRALRGEARLVLVDLPPFGTAELHEGYALGPDDHADLLAAVIDEQAVGPTTVVGQSMGGWVTQWLAHEHGDLVDAVVMLATAGTRLEGSFDAVDRMTPHSPEGVRAYLDAIWYEPPLGTSAIAGYLLGRMHDPQVRGFLALTEHGHTLSDAALARIETPAHVVWGADDDLLDPRTPGYLAKRWGGPLDRTYLARAAHMVHQERPDAVVARIRDASEQAAARARRQAGAPTP